MEIKVLDNSNLIKKEMLTKIPKTNSKTNKTSKKSKNIKKHKKWSKN
jgi:hypothetical protein